MLVLAALVIDSGDCETLELVTTEFVRRPYDAEVCISKGIFIKQHQYIRWALIFHKLKLILLLQPAQSTLIRWMLRIMSSTGSNAARPQVWGSVDKFGGMLGYPSLLTQPQPQGLSEGTCEDSQCIMMSFNLYKTRVLCMLCISMANNKYLEDCIFCLQAGIHLA